MRNFFRTLAPEKFDASITIHADGSYSYIFCGVLVFVPALIQASRVGLDAHADAQLRKAAEQLGREGFENAKYLGRGRYSAVLERNCAKGEASYFPSREMKVFSIRPRSDGSIVVGASRPDHSGPCRLAGADAEIDGKLSVTVDSGVEVLNHNAQASSSARGESAYTWSIKSPDLEPVLVIRPAEATFLEARRRSHPNFSERSG
jgi:hypothetical protein